MFILCSWQLSWIYWALHCALACIILTWEQSPYGGGYSVIPWDFFSIIYLTLVVIRGTNKFGKIFSSSPGIFSLPWMILAVAGGEHLCRERRGRGNFTEAGKSPLPSMPAGRCLTGVLCLPPKLPFCSMLPGNPLLLPLSHLITANCWKLYLNSYQTDKSLFD